MATWFLVRDGKEQGPFDDNQLKKLAADGILNPSDMVRRDGAAASPAKNIKGLFTLPTSANSASVRRPPPPPSRVQPNSSAPPPPSPEWHYLRDSVQHGPLTFNQLRDLAASGQLQASDLVWKAGTPDWQEARLINGLIPAKVAEPPQQQPPALPSPPNIGAQKRPWHRSWKFRVVAACFAGSVVFFNGVRGWMQTGNNKPSTSAQTPEKSMGTLLIFKKGELYYTPLIPAEDAKRLGNFLADQGYFDGVPKTVQVTKNGGTYELRMVVKKGVERDQEIRHLMEVMAKVISNRVFDGSPVHIHLCDDKLESLRVIFSND